MMDQAERLERITAGDISVFEVASQTTRKDKASLLAMQNFLRAEVGEYTYIEVGSHLGGSLVPHLADPACTEIASIDPRPTEIQDERGRMVKIEGNSTQRMIDGLADILPLPCLSKLKTYDCDAGELGSYNPTGNYTLGLIDGEHTNVAVFRDFLNIRPFMAKDSIVMFHDSNLVFDAMQNVETMLTKEGTKYESFFIPGILFAIAFGKLRKPAKKVIGPLSHDRDWYLPRARQKLQETISRNVKAA